MKTLFSSSPVLLEHLKTRTLFSLYGLEYPYLKLGYSRDKKYILCRRYITSKSYVVVKLLPCTLIESILKINENIDL